MSVEVSATDVRLSLTCSAIHQELPLPRLLLKQHPRISTIGLHCHINPNTSTEEVSCDRPPCDCAAVEPSDFDFIAANASFVAEKCSSTNVALGKTFRSYRLPKTEYHIQDTFIAAATSSSFNTACYPYVPAQDALMCTSATNTSLCNPVTILLTASTKLRTTPTALRTTPTALRTTPTALRTTPTALRTTNTSLHTTPAALLTTPTALRSTPTALRSTLTALRTTPTALRPHRTILRPTPTTLRTTPTTTSTPWWPALLLVLAACSSSSSISGGGPFVAAHCEKGFKFFSEELGECVPCTHCRPPLMTIIPCYEFMDTTCAVPEDYLGVELGGAGGTGGARAAVREEAGGRRSNAGGNREEKNGRRRAERRRKNKGRRGGKNTRNRDGDDTSKNPRRQNSNRNYGDLEEGVNFYRGDSNENVKGPYNHTATAEYYERDSDMGTYSNTKLGNDDIDSVNFIHRSSVPDSSNNVNSRKIVETDVVGKSGSSEVVSATSSLNHNPTSNSSISPITLPSNKTTISTADVTSTSVESPASKTTTTTIFEFRSLPLSGWSASVVLCLVLLTVLLAVAVLLLLVMQAVIFFKNRLLGRLKKRQACPTDPHDAAEGGNLDTASSSVLMQQRPAPSSSSSSPTSSSQPCPHHHHHKQMSLPELQLEHQQQQQKKKKPRKLGRGLGRVTASKIVHVARTYRPVPGSSKLDSNKGGSNDLKQHHRKQQQQLLLSQSSSTALTSSEALYSNSGDSSGSFYLSASSCTGDSASTYPLPPSPSASDACSKETTFTHFATSPSSSLRSPPRTKVIVFRSTVAAPTNPAVDEKKTSAKDAYGSIPSSSPVPELNSFVTNNIVTFDDGSTLSTITNFSTNNTIIGTNNNLNAANNLSYPYSQTLPTTYIRTSPPINQSVFNNSNFIIGSNNNNNNNSNNVGVSGSNVTTNNSVDSSGVGQVFPAVPEAKGSPIPYTMDRLLEQRRRLGCTSSVDTNIYVEMWKGGQSNTSSPALRTRRPQHTATSTLATTSSRGASVTSAASGDSRDTTGVSDGGGGGVGEDVMASVLERSLNNLNASPRGSKSAGVHRSSGHYHVRNEGSSGCSPASGSENTSLNNSPAPLHRGFTAGTHLAGSCGLGVGGGGSPLYSGVGCGCGVPTVRLSNKVTAHLNAASASSALLHGNPSTAFRHFR